MLKQEGNLISRPGKSLKSIKANESDCNYYFENDHIVIDKQSVTKGKHLILNSLRRAIPQQKEDLITPCWFPTVRTLSLF